MNDLEILEINTVNLSEDGFLIFKLPEGTDQDTLYQFKEHLESFMDGKLKNRVLILIGDEIQITKIDKES